MAEIWDLYDVHRELTGEIWIRGSKATIPKGRYHVVVSVWTVTPQGSILITKRHPGKSFGGMWENTGGAVMKGETSLEAARRELKEETGIDAPVGSLILLGDVWHPGCIVDTYLYLSNVDTDELVLQDDEVTEARLVDPEAIDELHQMTTIVPSVYRTFCCYRKDIKRILLNYSSN